MNNKKILDQTTFFIGEENEKNLAIIKEYAKNKNLPLVFAEQLKNCPMKLSAIKKEINNKKVEFLKLYMAVPFINGDKDLIDKELNSIKGEIIVLKEQYKLRKLFPHVKNYEEMGYDKGFASFLEYKYGAVTLSYYEKQFDTQLLKDIKEDLKSPCVINLGKDLTISLDNEYKKFTREFTKRHSGIFDRKFNLKNIGFDIIEDIFSDVKNVTYLKSKVNYESMYNDKNEMTYDYLCSVSDQYSQLATKTIDTTINDDESSM